MDDLLDGGPGLERSCVKRTDVFKTKLNEGLVR